MWRHADAPGLRGGGRGPAPAHAQASGAGNASIRTPDPYGALLIGRVRGGATAPQRNAIEALLSRLRATPRGDAILRAMQACHEKLGQVPEIVLIDDDPGAGQRPSLAEPMRGGVWHLHLSALASDDDAAVRELAAVYNNMTGLLQGGQPFREVYLNAFFRAGRSGRPAFEPALEAEWAAWAGGDARRRLAVNSMRQQLWLADCFGGLDKDAFIRVLQDELAPVPEGPSIHLYDRGLDAVPPLRDNTYELKIDHNRITDWRNLSRAKGLRRLSARDTGAGVFDELPTTLVFLDVSWNHLTRLPADRLARLEALEYLDVSNNVLGQIDGLPRTLKVLQAGRNSLASLPPLPPDLTTLIADHNVLTRISAPMPDTLETLVLSDNDLPGVPDLSATRIHTLKLARNRELAALPALPPTLSLLDVEDCALETLPTPLPAAIETVIASGNRLRDLPRGVPAGTRLLDVRDNALTGVPAEIDTPSCTILLHGNPIPIRVQEDLTARFRAGAGPQVRFIADEDPALDTASGTLADAARAWLGDEDAAAAARWEAIGADVRETPGGRAAGGQFARFLDYLRQSVSHDDPDFRADVREWLAELAKPERKPLLDRTLQACVTASEQCEDRVSLTLSELRRLRVHDDVRLGIYEPRNAVDALRQTFRIGKLQEIAYRHIKSDGHLDDVEVYLAYAVGLRDRLELSLVAPRMRFMSVSRVTAENLDAALQEVLDAEGKEFYRYLVLDDSWNALIRQRLGERYAQAEAQLHQLAGTPLQEKIRAELQARGIDGADTDAQRELGHAVWRDMKFEVLEPLTRRYLADAQLAVPEQG